MFRIILGIIVLSTATGCINTSRLYLLRNTFKECSEIPDTDHVVDLLLQSKKQRESGENWSETAFSGNPTELYLEFEKVHNKLASAESKQCSTYRKDTRIENHRGYFAKTSFQIEWDYQKEAENMRQNAFEEKRKRQELERKNEVLENEKIIREVIVLAKKNNLKDVIFQIGLTRILNQVVEGNLSLKDLERVAIELIENDDHAFTAIQVLGNGNALYISEYSNAVLLLKKNNEQIIEGSPLTAINASYVTIEGPTKYQTLFGSKQAFVIKPAWK